MKRTSDEVIAAEAGYGDEKAIKKLKKRGFEKKDFSTDEVQVYENDGNYLVNVRGTANLADWGTDVYLAAGHLKDTSRYQRAKEIADKVRAQPGVKSVSFVGHSLGGAIAQYIAKGDEQVTAYNAGYTIGQPTRQNTKAYRRSWDIVSALGSNQRTVRKWSDWIPPMSWSGLALKMLDAHTTTQFEHLGI
jgi:pimeloyl-ACP methyl ester carboxylesterase